MSKLRVLLADYHPIVLAGIKSLLTGDPELEIVGEARDGLTALSMAIALKADVVVLGLSTAGLNGADVIQQLLRECPDCKALVLTEQEDRSSVHRLIEVGAVGYVLKRSQPEDLVRAVHAVGAGGIYLDPAIAGQAIKRSVDRPQEAVPSCELSDREFEVLRLTAVGHANKAIATLLQISVKSVETYKARAMDKLGFHSRVELVCYAVDKGWLARD